MKKTGFSRALIVCVALFMGAASYAVSATAQAGKQVIWNDFNGPNTCLNSWKQKIGNAGAVMETAKMVGCTKATGQYWNTVPVSNNRYYMKTEWHGAFMCLSAFQNDLIRMNKCANMPGQKWYPVLLSNKNGGYKLHNDLFGNSKCLSVKNSGTYDELIMEPCSLFDGQVWHTRTQ